MFSTHIHTNNIGNVTKQTTSQNKQKIRKRKYKKSKDWEAKRYPADYTKFDVKGDTERTEI